MEARTLSVPENSSNSLPPYSSVPLPYALVVLGQTPRTLWNADGPPTNAGGYASPAHAKDTCEPARALLSAETEERKNYATETSATAAYSHDDVGDYWELCVNHAL